MNDSPRRARILEVAERLFGHYGHKKTTMAEIARGCGIGVGSLYLDFDSKDAILSALAGDRSRAVRERMTAALRGESSRDRGGVAAVALVRMLEARVAALLELGEGDAHAADLVRCPTQRDACGFDDGARALLRRALEDGVTAGQLDAEDLDATVATIELAFEGLSPPRLYALPREVAEQRAGALAALVVFGLSAPRPHSPHRSRPSSPRKRTPR